MINPAKTGLDFEIDKLTDSIEQLDTGLSFATKTKLVIRPDLKDVLKKNGWRFNWKSELREPNREVYQLVTKLEPRLIQGLISIETKSDHVYMHLLESAPWNIGSKKSYAGVAGNLVAFACKLSFEVGHEGNVGFFSKTRLIRHYEETLGARHLGNHLMAIDQNAAAILISKYYKEE